MIREKAITQKNNDIHANIIVRAERTINFNIDNDGLYAIFVTASCKKGKDLRLEIDGEYFREVPAYANIQKFKVAAAWNGNLLKGLDQTNVYVMNLEKGKHEISFYVRKPAVAKAGDLVDEDNTDAFEIIDWKCEHIGPAVFEENTVDYAVSLTLDQIAQKRDRQPWINFIFKDISLRAIKPNLSLKWGTKWDGDDVKIIVDGRTRQADSKLLRNWYFSTIRGDFVNSDIEYIITNLSPGNHAIELWADQTPVINSIDLILSGKVPDQWTDSQKSLITLIKKTHENAKALDCYCETYAKDKLNLGKLLHRNDIPEPVDAIGVEYAKQALIFYDPEYDSTDDSISSHYLVYFWNSLYQKWESVAVYGKEHNSETESDYGINIAGDQPEANQPLPAGWHAVFLGSHWWMHHMTDWHIDDNWMMFKI